ncbi:MAG: hypothetical protein IT314_01390, partial [Anaerolineales bacterium]|nr:hypothetical protein [Anaerolineales bacterium]
MSSLHRLFTIFICLCAGLTACATPQTPPLPPGEGTEVRETPPSSVTLTATLTPTETLAPTSTPEPTPTPEEVGEFIPANKIEFVDALPDYNLTLAPDANIKGIYWDIIISHLGDAISKSIP